MILVSLGTQKQQFLRLLNMVKNSKELQNERIVAQIGYTKFQDNCIETFDFVDNYKLEQFIKNSDLIICHAGVGTIFQALQNNKKVIACPRYKKYKEHINDHQLEICEALEKEGFILTCLDGENLDEKIKEARNKKFKKYIRNEDYLDILRKEI